MRPRRFYSAEVTKKNFKLIREDTNQTFEEIPLIATKPYGRRKIIEAIGNTAESLTGHTSIEVVNPFDDNLFAVENKDYAVAIINHALYTLTRTNRRFWTYDVLKWVLPDIADKGLSSAEGKSAKYVFTKIGVGETLIFKSIPEPSMPLKNLRRSALLKIDGTRQGYLNFQL